MSLQLLFLRTLQLIVSVLRERRGEERERERVHFQLMFFFLLVANDISSFTSQSLEFTSPTNISCFSINISNTDSFEGDEMFRIDWSLSGAPPNVKITPPTMTFITIECEKLYYLMKTVL